MKQQHGFVKFVLVAVVLVAAHNAFALSRPVNEPDIFFPKGYDQQKSDAILKVLQDKQFRFLGGLTSFWEPDFGTTLVYEGDTKSLNAFLSTLGQVQDIRVRVSFSKDLARETGSALQAGSWWVKYSHVTPDTLTVRINLAAKDIDAEQLEIWSAPRADHAK